MKLIIVSGLSGSGKTVALRTLEDAGYYCIDNLPLGMLPELVDNMVDIGPQPYDQVAIAIDARSGVDKSDRFDEIMRHVSKHPLELKILFLTCDTSRLLKRFSETRRKHPLSRQGLPLADAIQQEKKLLEGIYANAHLSIDSSNLNVHELRQMIIDRLLSQTNSEMGILIQSFGFKNGVPADTDFVFDVRCLPNPHWERDLKPLSGRDRAVVKYLENYPEVEEMFESIMRFLVDWTPRFEKENRSYMTISIGCTGGKHRSVYLAERIAAAFGRQRNNISIRHRDLQ
ncbi:MAG: RNase adapter RapZ [Gammaproteobacteria bacterium]|nr:RNase adapter RapZ [Gammaproteobacteria bacterium]MDH3447566.1 RNase adapter RapZ [Gammaproteobacteria bacterium]